MTRWPSLVLIALLALLLGAAGGARAAESAFGRTWSGLWHTPDQRAQAALDAGDAAAAARQFRDPRRKAYAELKAGRYQEAAKGLAAFDDAAAQYDRGNALARAGDLQQALQAYDAALAKDPNDRDARHNRDLVAKALARQPPPTKPSGNPGSSGDSGQSGGSGKAGNSGKAGKAGGSGPAGSPGNAASAPSSGHEAASSPSSGAESSAAGSGHETSPATAGAASQPSAGAASAPGSTVHDEAAQVQREAAAARAAASAAGARAADDALGAASAPAGRDAPTTEQQLAEDQWLRGIPDDPAGLLRRKFLIQHLMRQQGGQP